MARPRSPSPAASAPPPPASPSKPAKSRSSATPAPRKASSARITRAGRVALVGRPNVGKSTLLNALLGERIAITSRHPQTTRDRVAGIVTHKHAQLVFVDTPGLHRARTRLGTRMNQEAREGARDADVVVFLIDVAPGMKPELRDIDQAILRSLPAGKPVILVLNKIDKIKAKHDLFPILEGLGKNGEFAAVVPVSALAADGASSVLDECARLMPKGPLLFEEDEISDKPVRFFVAEFVREQILRKTREEVPHGVAVVVERFEDGGRVAKIDLVVHVDKDSHKKIVIGAGGSLLKEIGTRARARVENLLGRQVHLQIWVRVTPGWYQKDSLLRDLGYEPPSADSGDALDMRKRREEPEELPDVKLETEADDGDPDDARPGAPLEDDGGEDDDGARGGEEADDAGFP